MAKDKYLFFDMDGTLISRTTHHIPESAVEGIRLAMKNGHHCFLCTGRAYAMAQEYQNEIELPGIVFCNGAGIAWQGRILETRNIDPRHVRDITELCDSLGGGYQILTETYAYQNQAEHDRFVGRFPKQYPDLSVEEVFARKGMKPIDAYEQEAVQKIDVCFTNELTADVFFSRVPASLNLILAGGYYAGMGRQGGELMAEGVSKGSGIRRVLDLFSASTHDAYGFGDSENDIEMLQTCGTGIAMGNASEACKKSADYITNDYDHDGIWNALKKFELI